uniref:Uncharacterized protein n=1 Tax=Plectus sambesii TaxID=2011161 RepID=A0A914W9E9_9BILA
MRRSGRWRADKWAATRTIDRRPRRPTERRTDGGRRGHKGADEATKAAIASSPFLSPLLTPHWRRATKYPHERRRNNAKADASIPIETIRTLTTTRPAFVRPQLLTSWQSELGPTRKLATPRAPPSQTGSRIAPCHSKWQTVDLANNGCAVGNRQTVAPSDPRPTHRASTLENKTPHATLYQSFLPIIAGRQSASDHSTPAATTN